MAAIEAMLIDRQVTALTAALITNIDKDDTSRVSKIVVGQYEGDIRKDRIVLQCLDAHPVKEAEWANEMEDYQADLGFSLPEGGRGFIGPTRWDTLRGTVKISVCLDKTKETGSEAMNIRQLVLARAENTLETDTTLYGFRDEFNSLCQLFTVSRVLKYQQVDDNMVAYIDWAALVTKRR